LHRVAPAAGGIVAIQGVHERFKKGGEMYTHMIQFPVECWNDVDLIGGV